MCMFCARPLRGVTPLPAGSTVSALRSSAAALKQYGRSMDIDRLNGLMSRLEDASDMAVDVHDAFDVNIAPDVDESMLEEELMAMEQDEPAAGSESVPVAAAQSTPAAAPVSAPAPNQTLVEQSDSEAERAALLENMGDTG